MIVPVMHQFRVGDYISGTSGDLYRVVKIKDHVELTLRETYLLERLWLRFRLWAARRK